MEIAQSMDFVTDDDAQPDNFPSMVVLTFVCGEFDIHRPRRFRFIKLFGRTFIFELFEDLG